MLKLKLQYFGHLMTHWKRLCCWEGLGAGGEGDDRGWDGWMASPTQWTWVWVNSRSWWWTERPGVLRFMGSQRVRHDWVTELNGTELIQLVNKLKCWAFLTLTAVHAPWLQRTELLESQPYSSSALTLLFLILLREMAETKPLHFVPRGPSPVIENSITETRQRWGKITTTLASKPPQSQLCKLPTGSHLYSLQGCKEMQWFS